MSIYASFSRGVTGCWDDGLDICGFSGVFRLYDFRKRCHLRTSAIHEYYGWTFCREQHGSLSDTVRSRPTTGIQNGIQNGGP